MSCHAPNRQALPQDINWLELAPTTSRPLETPHAHPLAAVRHDARRQLAADGLRQPPVSTHHPGRSGRAAPRFGLRQRLSEPRRTARQPGTGAAAPGRKLGCAGGRHRGLQAADGLAGHTPRHAGHAGRQPEVPGRRGALCLRAWGAGFRAGHAQRVHAAAAHLGRCRPVHLQGQGHLQAHPALRGLRRAQLHAGRGSHAAQGWLLPLRTRRAGLGLGAGADPGRARACRRPASTRPRLRPKPCRLRRALEERHPGRLADGRRHRGAAAGQPRVSGAAGRRQNRDRPSPRHRPRAARGRLRGRGRALALSTRLAP